MGKALTNVNLLMKLFIDDDHKLCEYITQMWLWYRDWMSGWAMKSFSAKWPVASQTAPTRGSDSGPLESRVWIATSHNWTAFNTRSILSRFIFLLSRLIPYWFGPISRSLTALGIGIHDFSRHLNACHLLAGGVCETVFDLDGNLKKPSLHCFSRASCMFHLPADRRVSLRTKPWTDSSRLAWLDMKGRCCQSCTGRLVAPGRASHDLGSLLWSPRTACWC